MPDITDNLLLVAFLGWAAIVATTILLALVLGTLWRPANQTRRNIPTAKPVARPAEEAFRQVLITIIARVSDPRLLVIVGIGIAILGLIFSRCTHGDIRYSFFASCSRGIDDLQLFGVPYAWQLGVSVCFVLYAAYCFLQESRKVNK
jgi:hypothetical protein